MKSTVCPRARWRRVVAAAVAVMGVAGTLSAGLASAASAATGPSVSAVSPNYGPPSGAITEVAGFPADTETPATGGQSAINITTGAVGDLVVLSVQIHLKPFSFSVSGGNVGTWHQAVSYDGTTDALHFEVWWGVVTAVGNSNITVNYTPESSLPNNTGVELVADSFTAPGESWSVVTAGGSSGNSGTAQFPSLSSGAHAQQVYWGSSEEESSGVANSCSAGFVNYCHLTSVGLNCYLSDPALAPLASYAPTCGVSSPAVWTAVGVVFAASADSPVTISGSNFVGGDTVNFGSAGPGLAVTVASPNTITAVPPSGSAGTVDVTVSGPGGSSAVTPADRYTYLAPGQPFVSSVSPNSGPTAGGNAVTVQGINLGGATGVDFGGAAASRVNVTSGSSLTAVAPPGVGTVDVTVTTGSGTSPLTGADQYTYADTSPTIGGSYDMVGADGGVFVFPVGAGTGFYGSLPGLGVRVNDIVGIVPTSDSKGYWLVGSDGGVFAFGDAGYIGSLPGLGVRVNDIVGIVPTSDSKGYWLVGRDGGVFAFGDATYVQSLPGLGVHVDNIEGIAATATGKGYWLLAFNGAIYALGDAHYYGGAPSTFAVGIAAAKDGNGYWVAGLDGQVWSFGSAGNYGDLPRLGVSVSSIVSLVPTPDGGGYWLIGHDGGVFAFGDAGFVGSLPGINVAVRNVVGAVPTTEGAVPTT